MHYKYTNKNYIIAGNILGAVEGIKELETQVQYSCTHISHNT